MNFDLLQRAVLLGSIKYKQETYTAKHSCLYWFYANADFSKSIGWFSKQNGQQSANANQQIFPADLAIPRKIEMGLFPPIKLFTLHVEAPRLPPLKDSFLLPSTLLSKTKHRKKKRRKALLQCDIRFLSAGSEATAKRWSLPAAPVSASFSLLLLLWGILNKWGVAHFNHVSDIVSVKGRWL